jgi:hypothetical protein
MRRSLLGMGVMPIAQDKDEDNGNGGGQGRQIIIIVFVVQRCTNTPPRMWCGSTTGHLWMGRCQAMEKI